MSLTAPKSLGGGYSELFRRPEGPRADLWREVGKLLLRQARHPNSIVIFQVPSHLEAREYLARRIPSWLVLGNACVDVLAGAAAAHARVPQASRHQVMSIEYKAMLVRRRLLRVGLDSIRAAQMSGEAGAPVRSGPPPPPPSTSYCCRTLRVFPLPDRKW